jgi:pimeloyl-ACP methyl ester carboxylesterase
VPFHDLVHGVLPSLCRTSPVVPTRGEFDPAVFTVADHAALDGTWAEMGEDAGAAGQAGADGMIDDDVALVTPWGCDLADVTAPVLFVHGAQDRVIPPRTPT